MADTPSPEALKSADETVAEWCDMHGGSGPDCDPSFDELTTSVALALDRFAAARVAAEREREPAYVYNPEDWEATYVWGDRALLADHEEVNWRGRDAPIHFKTLIQGPDKWAANVVLTRDEAGDPDDEEIRWFDSEEEALAAIRGGAAP